MMKPEIHPEAGLVDWKQLDPDDPKTFPPERSVMFFILPKSRTGAAPVFVAKGFWEEGPKTVREIIKEKELKNGIIMIQRSRQWTVAELSDIAWAERNVPHWWILGTEKEEE